MDQLPLDALGYILQWMPFYLAVRARINKNWLRALWDVYPRIKQFLDEYSPTTYDKLLIRAAATGNTEVFQLLAYNKNRGYAKAAQAAVNNNQVEMLIFLVENYDYISISKWPYELFPNSLLANVICNADSPEIFERYWLPSYDPTMKNDIHNLYWLLTQKKFKIAEYLFQSYISPFTKYQMPDYFQNICLKLTGSTLWTELKKLTI